MIAVSVSGAPNSYPILNTGISHIYRGLVPVPPVDMETTDTEEPCIYCSPPCVPVPITFAVMVLIAAMAAQMFLA